MSTGADTVWSRDVVFNPEQGPFDMNRNGPYSEESSSNSRWYSASSHQLPFSLLQATSQLGEWMSMLAVRPMDLHSLSVQLKTRLLHLSSRQLHFSS